MAAPPPLLVAWDLSHRHVVVVGGGAIGQGKVEGLAATGARITVIDPTPTLRIRELADRGVVTLVRRRFRRRDLRGAALVIAATGDPATNGAILAGARRYGALVNAVDDPDRCDVTIPAVVRRGPATIAVSTDGSSPAGARFLREQISEALPPEVAELLVEAAAARDELRRTGRYRYDYPAWRQRFFEPGLAAVRAGRLAGLGELRRRLVAGFASPVALRTGRVTLVGAGPGGADLITVRGARALAAADVVLYDRLADPALLDLAPVAAERIPVGKAKGEGMDQDDIARLLVERALQGNHVVRLKGGDPFVFGRGAEELDAVWAAGIEASVVPGLTSAIAGPALAGIPLTHREDAASFLVLTGHRAGATDADWSAVARAADTLVVLMGASTAPELAANLVAGGRPPTDPVAVVHRAGLPGQQVRTLDLATLAASGSPLPSPSVLVIGPVARRATGSPTPATTRVPTD